MVPFRALGVKTLVFGSNGLVDVKEAGEEGIWVSRGKGSGSTVTGVNITRQSRFCPI